MENLLFHYFERAEKLCLDCGLTYHATQSLEQQTMLLDKITRKPYIRFRCTFTSQDSSKDILIVLQNLSKMMNLRKKRLPIQGSMCLLLSDRSIILLDVVSDMSYFFKTQSSGRAFDGVHVNKKNLDDTLKFH